MNRNVPIFKLLTCLLCQLLAVSCGEDITTKSVSDHNADPISKLVNEYYGSMYSPGTRGLSTPKITGVVNKTHHILVSKDTRAEDGDAYVTFDMQTVTLDFGETKGFAIMSSDERLNRIFYFTDNGSLSDTTVIKPLRDLIEVYPLVAADHIVNGNRCDVSKYITRGENGPNIPIVEPFVKYKWGQGYPFNLCAGYCVCFDCALRRNHRPIGCIAVAVGQALATMGNFEGHYYGSKDIDFANLPEYGYQMTETQGIKVGRFMADIALGCNIKFDCNGSGTFLRNAYNYLVESGYDVEYTEGPLDAAKVIDNCTHGRPHLISGDDGKQGHAWIIDGIGVSNGAFDFHCNWGWNGKSNGWTTGTPFIAETYNDVYEFCNNLSNIYIYSKNQ